MSNRSLCSSCGANRGLAEYENGTYCFSCKEIIKHKSLLKEEKKDKKLIKIPEDNQLDFPDFAYDWINQYQDKDSGSIMKHCFWSDEYQRVVFPSSCGKAAWMRRVVETTRPEYKPKWLFAGDKEVVFYYDYANLKDVNSDWNNPGRICLVEDIVSAIKVSSVIDSLCVGGTILKENQIEWLNYNQYQHIYIYLDGDGAGRKGAESIRKQLKLVGHTTIIRMPCDPKCLSYSQLEEILK